ncbi:chromate transporter [Xanthobacter sp. TB0139]|uniref:chromate transporter n=1 Tax=Xanthobacter sp. TB0139 TaxID=3459178 RepID=UPI0040391513
MWNIFLTFLIIGATSFGGGTFAYLHNSLVLKKKWLDEDGFMAALSVAEALPGLNAVNISVIVGDRLRGVSGAIAGFLGMTIPGGVFILTLGVLYATHHQNPWINQALIGVGAASVGLLASIALQLGKKQLTHRLDLVVIAVTVVMISFLHISLVWVLLTVGPVAFLLYRGHGSKAPGPHGQPVD